MKKVLTILWLLLFLFAMIAGLARAVVLFENTALDETVQAVGRIHYTSVPFPTTVRYLAILRLLGLLACLAAAGVIYLRASPPARRGAAGFTAFLLAVLPHISLLGAANVAPFPDPWAGWLTGIWNILNIAGILAMFVSLYILPTGLPRGWLRWISIAILAISFGAFFALFSGLVENAWIPVSLVLLVSLIIGVGWQAFRLWKPGIEGQRRQTGWVNLALVLLGIWALFSAFFLGTLANQNRDWFVLELHLQAATLALLSFVLAQAVLERGLWESSPVLTRRWVLAPALLGLLALANLGWLGAGALTYHPAAPQNALPPLSAGQTRPVVIDTDMGADDWMAILYLLQRSDITVKAITVSGTGLAHCKPGVENALRLVALAGSEPIPVACGRTTPLQGFHYFPGSWRDGSDRFTSPAPDPAANPAAGQEAVTVLSQALRSAPQPTVLLALGPLTNLAEALQNDPGLKDQVEMVFIMGGAVDASGNLVEGGVDNAWGEWNVYIDPLAMQIVLDSGVPVTLVALDATNHVPATRAFVTRLAGQKKTPATEFVVRVLEANPGLDVLFGYYFWDPLAAGLLADESLGRYQERRLQVVTAEGYRSGQLMEHESGAPVRLAVWADRARFEQALLVTYGSQPR